MALVNGTNFGFVTTAPVDDPGGSLLQYDNYAYYVRATAPADGIVTEIGMWTNTIIANAPADVALYDDNSDTPNNLVGSVTETTVGAAANNWLRVSGLEINITKSTVYWIAFQVDNVPSSKYSDGTTDAAEKYYYDSGSVGLVEPAITDGSYGRSFAIYALYSPIGGPAAPVRGFMTTNTKFWGV